MAFDRLRAWAHDSALRKLFQNAGTLVVGNAMQSALGLVSLALTARGLGPADFGKLAIAVTYASVITQLVGFQSWQAVIRYGADALERNRPTQFVGIIKAGFALDLAAAAVASLLALAGVAFGLNLIGLEGQSRAVALLVSVAILFNIVGTPTALLRIFDRYRLFVVQSFSTSLTKLVLVGIVFAAGGDLLAFACAWVGSQVFGYLLLAGLALRELLRRRYRIERSDKIIDVFREHPDLARFFLLTNLNGTVRTLRDLDVPILGALLGASATGSFKIARQLAGALNKVIDPFFFAVYPDLVRFHSAGQTASALRLVRRSALLLGAGAAIGFIAFLIAGEFLMVLVLGEQYRSTYPVTAWCVAGAVIWAFAQPIAPMLMTYGRQSALLVVNVTSTVLYLAGLALASVHFGLSAAGAAFAGFLLLWALLSGRLLMTTAKAHARAAHATTQI